VCSSDLAAARLGLDGERVGGALQSAAELLRHGVSRAADAVPVVAELQDLAATASKAKSGR